MDTVIGKQEDSKRILTLLIKRYELLIIILLPNGKAQSVVDALNNLQEKIGLDYYRELFPLILTDRGSEFQHVDDLELDKNKEVISTVYYCDPMCFWQKPFVERAHEYIRYVLKKGTSFESLTQEDFTLLMNHINSYTRDGIGGKSPYQMVKENDAAVKKLMEVLHMQAIPPNEVHLKPALLKK